MYIKKLKEFISITLDDYRNESYSAQHNQLVLQKIWPTFITLVKLYAIIGIIYIIIQNSLYFSSFNTTIFILFLDFYKICFLINQSNCKPHTTFYFYIQLVAIVLYIAVVERFINYLRESYKLRLIIFTFILIETSFQMYLIEVYLTDDAKNQALTTCQLFINLLLVLVIQYSHKRFFQK